MRTSISWIEQNVPVYIMHSFVLVATRFVTQRQSSNNCLSLFYINPRNLFAYERWPLKIKTQGSDVNSNQIQSLKSLYEQSGIG